MQKKSQIILGDSLEELKKLGTNSIDAVITDPPYGYSFMGKNWDKAVPSVELWAECLRVLKPGAFACVMSAPRSDVQMHMIMNLEQAGFRVDFTPIYWTYASGFPKAGNIAKLVDKRLGVEPIRGEAKPYTNDKAIQGDSYSKGGYERIQTYYTKPNSDQAKALDGSYAGFQPKPAVEVIIVAMKPLSEKTYVDQALTNGHGVSWLDHARIPTSETITNHSRSADAAISKGKYGDSKAQDTHQTDGQKLGRFPANLLVSDDVLNDGKVSKSHSSVGDKGRPIFNGSDSATTIEYAYPDRGSYSRYFDLDKWAQTLPFLIVPKASKSEKNKGLTGEQKTIARSNGVQSGNDYSEGTLGYNKEVKSINNHPTVKPIKLMSYLITLFSRPNDTVLDPFVGSGTTVVAAKQLDRNGIDIEREAEYVVIAEARLDVRINNQQTELI